MSEQIQFFTDQHFPGPVIRGMRRNGIEVLTATDAGRCGFADDQQLAFATDQERVMLTFDSDYLALHRAGVQHAGIAWCPQRKHKFGELLHAVLLLHGVLDRRSMRNHVEYL